MRTNKINTQSNGRTWAKRLTAIVVGVIGFLVIQPFIWLVMMGPHEVYMSLSHIFYTFLFVFGLPMLVFGFVGFLIGGRNSQGGSTTDLELSRIRFTVETDRMNRK